MRNGEDPRIVSARCWCNECGWEMEFDRSECSKHAGVEQSAKSRLAGHTSGPRCDYEHTDYELTYAEIEFGNID